MNDVCITNGVICMYKTVNRIKKMIQTKRFRESSCKHCTTSVLVEAIFQFATLGV